MSSEIWRPIPEIPGFEVSDQGRVRDAKGKFRRICKTRYSTVSIRDRNYSVHVLVTAAFLGECPVGMIRNHKNGDKHDNRPENLEYVTYSQNLQHAYDVLRRKGPEGEIHGRAKLTESTVKTIFDEHSRGTSAKTLAARFGVTMWTVFDIRAGRSWRHLGLTA